MPYTLNILPILKYMCVVRPELDLKNVLIAFEIDLPALYINIQNKKFQNLPLTECRLISNQTNEYSTSQL